MTIHSIGTKALKLRQVPQQEPSLFYLPALLIFIQYLDYKVTGGKAFALPY